MDINRIDLNLLVVLEAIYTEGGLTRAGERLNVTQPAVSHALNRLRSLLDDPLFTREGHRMVPTPFMRSLIGPLQQSLQSLQNTLNEAKRFDPGSAAKHFTLGCRDILESRVLPQLMRVLPLEAPGVDVVTARLERRAAVADLLSGRLDAIADSILPDSPDIRHVPVASDRLAVVARRDHPALRDGLSLEIYLAQEHILVSSRRSGSGVVEYELGRRGLRRRVRLRCQHYFAAARVVSESDLLLTMPERVAHIINREQGNQVLPFPLEVPPQPIYLYWHVSVDSDPASRWFRGKLIEAFAESSAAL